MHGTFPVAAEPELHRDWRRWNWRLLRVLAPAGLAIGPRSANPEMPPGQQRRRDGRARP